jgi:hypothetical protein
MKCKYLYLVGLLLVVGGLNYANGQNWEGGLFAGASNYKGDLAPYLAPSETHPAVGVFVKRNLSPFFSLALTAKQGAISGDDENFDHLKDRNLSFESDITEVSAIIEFNFFPFLKGLGPDQFTPYVYSGFAFFRFEPTTTFKGETFDLQEFRTEGQGVTSDAPGQYSGLQPAIPIGGGFKLQLNRRLNLTFKLGYRATFTDFLDDVSTDFPSKDALSNARGKQAVNLSDRSVDEWYTGKGKQRGNPQNNDWYLFTGFTFSYNIKNPDCYEF